MAADSESALLSTAIAPRFTRATQIAQAQARAALAEAETGVKAGAKSDAGKVADTQAAGAEGESKAGESKVWQDGETTSFKDILAILNPLQHIPVVSTIYRSITGDQIGFMPRVIGSAIYGGPIGFAIGLVNGLLKSETGKDAGESVASLFGSEPPPAGTPAATDLMAKAPSATPHAPAPQTQMAASPASQAQGSQAQGSQASGSQAIPQISENALARLMARSSGAASAEPSSNPASPNLAAAAAPAPANPLSGTPGTLPQTGGITLKFQGDNPRFRSTSLPQPVGEGGGLATHTAADLVPTPDGAAISREQVPNAMMRALEKYGDMMRSRTAQQTASAAQAAGPVNVLR